MVRARASAGTAPLRISGIYPHLAVFNGRYDAESDTWHGTGKECGIGAVVPWVDRLWLITYPPHATHGSPDKLWTIDRDLRLTMRPESVGGTHACRMIHRETNQLIIGPYFVDTEGNVRACDVKDELVGRMTAVARHLSEPEKRVYFFDMEGAIYEVSVRTLAVTKLFAKPVPGWHGKGGYTGQGRFIIANNGEHGPRGALKHLQVGGPSRGPDEIGCLAEWDGETWRIVERKQFLDVTGPGGIHGAPDAEAPVWAIGWDRRSCILKLLDAGTWHTFRLPKASHSYDPAHGWYTEWPRIREVTDGTWLMDLHGMFYDFPPGFRLGHTGGLVPLASHLRYIPDFCAWRGQVVLAADDASLMGNPMCGKAQSNLWFGSLAELRHWGPRSAWGGPWVGDRVTAGEPSEPFLIDGFEGRCLHLSTHAGPPAGQPLRTADKFPITALPDPLAGLTRVALPRGDYHEPAPGCAFAVNQPVVVYLAVDDRGTPELGEGWERTELRLRWGGSYTDTIYRKRFDAGSVEVPGRSQPHNEEGHYPLPNLAFVQRVRSDGDSLAIAGLPDDLGARVVRPPRADAAPQNLSVRLEIDRKGTGQWEPYETVHLPNSGYAWHVFPPGFNAAWVRLTPNHDARATAYFHFASPRAAAEGEQGRFAALAQANDTPLCSGLIRPAAHNTRLQFLAQATDADGTVQDAGYWEVDESLAFRRVEPGRAEEVQEICATKRDFAVDEASAIMTWKGRRYRLPKGAAAFDQPFPTGWPRGIREVQSERYLANIHGTLYEMPRDTGVPDLRPVCTHNRRIVDFCSWRGLLVISGTRIDAEPDGQYFASEDGEVGLWFGAVDDLWALGKPVGQGGPWRDTAVTAGVPSDPYLMTNYDRKRVALSHDADQPVTFTLEVDVDHRSWNPYKSIAVPPGETVPHRFPEGYNAHWIRVVADRDCTATAWFVYE
jgi:hypothetical protein